ISPTAPRLCPDLPQPTGMKPAALLNTFPLVLVLASFNAYSPTQCENVRNSYQLMTVPLPEFLLSATLSRVIGKHLPNCLSQVSFSEPIVFDWSEVCFF